MSKSLLLVSASLLVTPAFAQDMSTADDQDTIIVTGSPIERSLDETLVGTSVIQGEELERSLSGTIGETLRQVPGVSSTSFGAGASRPVIRGLGGDRVRILDNGIGSIDASSASPDHAVAVEPALAERIEIVRGAAILRYGSSAAGGVVDVIHPRIPREVPENGLEAAGRLTATTVDEGAEAAAGITLGAGKIGGADLVLHLDGTWRDADDYDIPGFAESSRLRALEEQEHEEEDHDEEDHEDEEEARDTLPNSFVESQSVAAGASLVGDRGFFGVSVKRFDSTYGIPGGHEHAHGHEEGEEEEGHDEEEHGEEEGDVFIELEQTRVDFNGRLELGDGFFEAVQLFGGIADYEHIEFEGPGEPGTVFTNEGWELRVEALQAARDGWRGATGVQLRHRDFEAIGDEAFVAPSETDQFGLFTFQELRTGPWLLEAAARYERTEHENVTEGIERSFDGISVSAGAGYEWNDLVSTGVTLLRTERAPTTEELFSNGPHLATSQFELGDPTLDIESATGAEFVVRVGNRENGITFNAFYTDYSDYIYERFTGEEEDELDVYQFTATDAVFQGFEIEGDLQLGMAGPFDLSADVVADKVTAELDVDGNDNLPRIPPVSATIGLNADSERFGARGEVEWAGEQDSIAIGELPTDSYTMLHAYLDWRPLGPQSPLTISVAGLNLTDEEARNHVSFLKDEVPLPGRNFRLSVRYAY
jgi:iron complex outermembrane receptor protein